MRRQMVTTMYNKRSYCLLSPIPTAVLSTILPLAYLALMGMCCWFRVVTISPFRLLNRVSVWAVKVDEEQSIVTFLVPPFFPQVFSMFLSLKANWIMYAKWNESDYKIRSLGLKRVGKWTMCPPTHTKPRQVISHFNTLLPLVVTTKSVKVYGL